MAEKVLPTSILVEMISEEENINGILKNLETEKQQNKICRMINYK